METTTQNFAKAAMLIRKPVAEVFEAFVNPEITTKIWFTRSTGPLEKGRQLEWVWEMYDVAVPVFVREVEPHKKSKLSGATRAKKPWLPGPFLQQVKEKHL